MAATLDFWQVNPSDEADVKERSRREGEDKMQPYGYWEVCCWSSWLVVHSFTRSIDRSLYLAFSSGMDDRTMGMNE